MVKVEEKRGGKYKVKESEVSKELYHSHMPVKKEENNFLLINFFQKVSLLDVQRKKKTFEGIKRKMCCFEGKDIKSEAGSSSLKLKDLPKKLKDPGSFNINVSINDLIVNKALLDLWLSINLMPVTMLRQIGDLEVKSTKMQLQLVDKTVKHPYGVVEDVLMKVDKFMFSVDFVILDMKEDEEVPLILGRPFMKTARVIVDVDKGALRVRSQEDEVRFKLFDDMTDCIVDIMGDKKSFPKKRSSL